MRAQQNRPATKAELVRLRKEIAVSRESLELLEHKRDILMAEGLQLLKTAKGLRLQVTRSWKDIETNWREALQYKSPDGLRKLADDVATMGPLEGGERRWMSVRLAAYECQCPEPGLLGSIGELDLRTEQVRGSLAGLLPKLVELMNMETNIRKVAVALKKCHRQVNALSQIVIPELNNERLRIEQRLEEKEREAIFQVKLLKARLS